LFSALCTSIAWVANILSASIKSIALRRFLPVLAISIQKNMKSSEDDAVRESVLKSLSFLVAKFVLGRKGAPDKKKKSSKKGKKEEEEGIGNNEEIDIIEEYEDEDEDEDGLEAIPEDEAEIMKVFRSSLGRRIPALAKKKIFVNKAEQKLIKDLESVETIKDLRAKYLPDYLKEFCDDWLFKLTEKDYSRRIHLVWKLFAEVDMDSFEQHLHAGASTSVRFVGIDSTKLGIIWSKYLKYCSEETTQSITKELQTTVSFSDNAESSTESEDSHEEGSVSDAGSTSSSTSKSSNFSQSQKDNAKQTRYRLINAKGKMLKNSDAWVQNQGILWWLIFPGVFDFCKREGDNNHFIFQNFAQINGRVFKGLFSNKHTFTASSKKRESGTDIGFNSLSWKSRLEDRKSMIDLGSLAGNLDERRMNELYPNDHPLAGRRKYGQSCNNKNFHGRVSVDRMVKEHECEIGQAALKSLLDSRAVICIDPGFVNTLGCIVALGRVDSETNQFKGDFKRVLMSSSGKYQNCGTNDHLLQRQKQDQSNPDPRLVSGKQQLRTKHSKTMDPMEYEKHYQLVLSDDYDYMMEANWSDENLKAAANLTRQKQRFWDNFRMDLWATVESLHVELGIHVLMYLIL